jgi:Fic family protein
MSYTEKLKIIDLLQQEINKQGALSTEVKKQINYRFSLDWNYYSNSMEGNTLTKDETRSVMVGNITVGGKPIKDVMEMEGHNHVISEIIRIGKGDARLSEKRIKDIHKGIMYAATPAEKKKIGEWKLKSNFVKNYKGKDFYFTAPEDVPEEIHRLLNKTNAEIDSIVAKKKTAPHPVSVALDFHLKYVSIHPFFDGNGRTSRILCNLILISFGYPPFVIKEDERENYYRYLADIQSEGGDPDLLYEFMADLIIRSQKIVLDAIAGKDISAPEDFDKEIELLKRLQNPPKEVIKKSKKVMQEILKEVYFPLILETDKHLSKLNKLFKSHHWAYFPEPQPPKYGIPMMPEIDTLRNVIQKLYTVTEEKESSYHGFKAVYWLMDYNDQDEFSLEVSFKIRFSETTYQVEIFVGQPMAGGAIMKSLTGLMKTLTKEKTPLDEFKTYYLPETEYTDPVLNEAIKDWAGEASKHALDYIKKKVITQKKNDK